LARVFLLVKKDLERKFYNKKFIEGEKHASKEILFYF
jgi:hypothetical protein